ncbi:unnamed protein product [Staurois parvus]|uniref:Uncharacterized protein n=1 Tax=Staurois parvus TaxID=386267 RepID=A0ABN9HMM9_9NEOB|nr:unnamed protein product [Staurois parvus]
MGPYLPPPHAAARSRVSHGSLYGLPLLLSPSPHSAMLPLSGLLTLLVFQFFDIGCAALRASHSCCQAPNLPWPLYRLLMLLPGPQVSHAMCPTFRSPHNCWCVEFFDIGCWQD